MSFSIFDNSFKTNHANRPSVVYFWDQKTLNIVYKMINDRNGQWTTLFIHRTFRSEISSYWTKDRSCENCLLDKKTKPHSFSLSHTLVTMFDINFSVYITFKLMMESPHEIMNTDLKKTTSHWIVHRVLHFAHVTFFKKIILFLYVHSLHTETEHCADSVSAYCRKRWTYSRQN